MFAYKCQNLLQMVYLWVYINPHEKLTKIKMFLLDICDENVGSMTYFVYPTPPAKQRRKIWVKKSHESTKMCDTAKIEHSTAKPCPYFFFFFFGGGGGGGGGGGVGVGWGWRGGGGGVVYIITHERAKQDKMFWVIWMLSGNHQVTDS